MSSQPSIAINARVTAFATGGQQRVAAEIMQRLPSAVQLMPHQPLNGLKGHAWEQTVLPFRARGKLLWSPSATGPLAHRNQIVTLHDTAFFDVPEFFSASFVKLYQSLIPKLVHRVARVVTVSEFSRKQISQFTGLAPNKIEVIHNGIAKNFRPYSPRDIAKMHREMNLPTKYLLVQATSDRRKNLARTLDAWRMVSSEMPSDLHLVVAGNLGRANVFGESTLDVSGDRIHVAGYVSEEHMGPLLAGAQALVFASLYEGFGLPVIEAMACGTPVITGNGSSLPEVAGNAAILVDATSTTAIAKAMYRIVSEPRLARALANAGFAQASKFSWDRATEQYIDLFNVIHSLGHRKTGLVKDTLLHSRPYPRANPLRRSDSV